MNTDVFEEQSTPPAMLTTLEERVGMPRSVARDDGTDEAAIMGMLAVIWPPQLVKVTAAEVGTELTTRPLAPDTMMGADVISQAWLFEVGRAEATMPSMPVEKVTPSTPTAVEPQPATKLLLLLLLTPLS